MRARSRSFEAFYEQNYDAVCRSLWAAFGGASNVEDAVQEAFTRAYVHWSRVSRMDRPVGWVHVVAVRLVLRRRGSPATLERLPAQDMADDVVAHEVLRTAIERLPTRQRVAVVLRYLADLPLRDVAAAMDCAVGTVKSTLHSALTRLEIELDDKDGEEADQRAT